MIGRPTFEQRDAIDGRRSRGTSTYRRVGMAISQGVFAFAASTITDPALRKLKSVARYECCQKLFIRLFI